MSNISALTHTRYWKYQQWTQPVFTSDTTWGFLNVSSVNSTYYAWRALDGVVPFNDNYGNTWETNNVTTGWWRWVFAKPLRIKGFTIYGRARPDGSVCSYGLIIKDLMQRVTLGEVPYQEVDGVKFWTFTLDEPIICDGLYITKTSSDGYSGIGELILDADEIVAGTEDDYDFSTQGYDYYVESVTKRKYYKKIAYIQPAFGANTYEYDTVIKGRNTRHVKLELTASHQSQPAWYAFNRSLTGDNCWWTNHGVTSVENPCWLTFQSNNKMLFNRVWLMNESASPENFNHCTLQASNDNLNWTDLIEFYGTNTASYVTSVYIPKEKQAPYYYYRLYFDSSYSTGDVSLQLITFEGSMVVESNEEDYDYYEEYTAFDIKPDDNRRFYKYNGVENPVPATIEDYDFYIKKGLTFTPRII